MGKKYLIHTNVLIDIQMRKLPASGLSFLASVIYMYKDIIDPCIKLRRTLPIKLPYAISYERSVLGNKKYFWFLTVPFLFEQIVNCVYWY